MKYVFYVDTFLAYQFCLQYLTITIIEKRLRRKTTPVRKILTTLLVSFGALESLLQRFVPYYVQLGILFFFLILVYGVVTFPWLPFVKKMQAVVIGGASLFVLGSVIMWTFQSFFVLSQIKQPILYVLFFGMITYEWLKKKKTNGRWETSELCTIILEGKPQITIHGLYDTGNRLVDPLTNRPVWILEKRVYRKLCHMQNTVFESCGCMNYQSLGNKDGTLELVKYPEITVFQNGESETYQNVALGIYDGILDGAKRFQMILPPL